VLRLVSLALALALLFSAAALAAPDPLRPQQWNLDLIEADAAHATSTGAGATVAVVDSGVQADHPDLAGRVVAGWDMVENDATPQDGAGHGTHVTGIVGAATGNGTGVAGVAPDARVLPVRVLDADGAGSDSTIAEGFDYAGRLGARIVNASLGGDGVSDTVTAAMEAHPNTLYVVAAGNEGADNDVAPVFPCTSPAPNVLCVGASDMRDRRASFSNYGATTVDVFAPGVYIESTLMGGGYGLMSGTSMAAPNAAGVAALALAAHPDATAAQLKAAVIGTVDPIGALTGSAVSGGRVNAAAAVTSAASLSAPAPTPTPTPTETPTTTPTPAPAAPAPTAAPPAPPAATPAPPLLGRLRLSGRLHGRKGSLRATFTLSSGTRVRVTIARPGHSRAPDASWSLATHAGANSLRISRRVGGHTLRRGAYTLTVAAGAGARAATFRVS
jgi:subtilisin family serine protease